MISYPEALNKILENAVSLPTEEVNMLATLGRINAHAVTSPASLPSFRNSAMDGYAVRAADLAQLDGQNAKELQLLATVYAGHRQPAISTADNTTVEVMTGAIVNDLYDTVIPVEQIHSATSTGIAFTHQPKPGANIRNIGEDFAVGDLVIPANNCITAEQLMALAALNIKKITAYRKAQVAIISTGKELIQPEHKSENGVMIYDSNGPYLQSWLRKCSFTEVGEVKNIYDDENVFIKHLSDLETAPTKTDIIISTGAVSAGKIDFIPKILANLGAKIIFHKVAIRPGKPIIFAVLKNGTYYFGLPGNPISAAVGMRFFVYPLLRKMCNLALEQPMMAKLTDDIIPKAPLCFFLKSWAEVNNQGISTVRILSGQESFKISPLTKANALVMLADGQKKYLKDELVPVYYFIGN